MRWLFCICCMLVVSLASGRVLSREEIVDFAQRYIAQGAVQGTFGGRGCSVVAVKWVALEDDCGVWCVEVAPRGHMILGVSTKFRALLSFSENTFLMPEKESPQYALLLQAAERSKAAEEYVEEEHPSWTIVASGTRDALASMDAVEFEPVGTTKWDQSTAMAWYLPGTAPCGCVATAMAQIMHALRWPVYAEGTFDGVLSYEDASGVKEEERYVVTPYTKFDYSMMHDVIIQSPTKYIYNQPIARLGLLCDILAEMRFKWNASGAITEWGMTTPWTVEPKQYSLTTARPSYSSEAVATIRQAAADKVPIGCSIPNHAIVGSGYATHGGEPYICINYGWGGTNSGWYPLGDMRMCMINYPKRTVQCDPLPSVSEEEVRLSWHLPTCYEDKVSGFKIDVMDLSPGTGARETWRDSFTMRSSDVSGNTTALYIASNELQVKYFNTSPKILYTWEPVFIPTEESQWTFSYRHSYTRGPLYLQVLPLGGVWETVEKIVPDQAIKESGEKICRIDLGKYAGRACKLRLFVYPYVYSQTYNQNWVEFAMKEMEVTQLSRVLTTSTISKTLFDVSARSYTFSKGDLMEGRSYAFMVTPLFKDSSLVGVMSMPCATSIEDGTHCAETFATLTVTSPSSQAETRAYMPVKQNIYRYCTYAGDSIIRVQTEENIETLELYSSHPDAFPEEAFRVERYGDGYFDIIIDGKILPESPRLNTFLNLTVVAVSKEGTRTGHELSLSFKTSSSDVLAETALPPVLQEIAYTDAEGITYTVPRTWFDGYGLAKCANKSTYDALMAMDSDGDGFFNREEYLLGTSPVDEDSKLKITGLLVDAEGVVSIDYEPKSNESIAIFKVLGKSTLLDEWKPHTDADKMHRFFKIQVVPSVN